jgi:hypothetical protein
MMEGRDRGRDATEVKVRNEEMWNDSAKTSGWAVNASIHEVKIELEKCTL